MSKLNNQLWTSADILRGKMDASEYKNYLLGLVFYKYLSDKQLRAVYEEENGNVAEYPSREEQFAGLMEWHNDDAEDIKDTISKKLGYFIEPEHLFYSLRENVDFLIADLENAFAGLGRQGEHFTGLFDDVDLKSTKLGSNAHQRNVTITEVIKALDEIDLFGHDGDVIGDAYEYLIGQFAAGAGKKAGEFYTPQAVSKIISEIVAIGQENVAPFHIYDPTMGSGSLMLNIREYMDENSKLKVHYHGQELNTTTYNLARMNLILHGVEKSQMRIKNGDTLDEDWPIDEPYLFNAVVMNPPYSSNWSADTKFLSDSRFERYGKLAPKSKADFAFLLHGFYHLKENGTMGIVLPHGVLFRGSAEGTIRKSLLEMGAIDAVIGLPPNIFYGTSIPTVVLILKKNRQSREVMFIDASSDYEKQKNQNNLRSEDIAKIVEAYKKRSNISKYAHLATFEEIVSNDYNLNIPRYVDTFEEEKSIDIVALSREITDLNVQIKQNENEFLGLLDQLEATDETRELIEATKRIFM